MEVSIQCQGAKTISIDKLIPFQGNLKDLSLENYSRLKREITQLGFSEPISIWEHGKKSYILNGHQRLRVLRKMRDEGATVPDIPVTIVQAKTIKEAKKKVLALTSQFGEMTNQGLYEFMSEADLAFDVDIKDHFRFPEIDLEKFEDEFFKQPDPEKEALEDEVPEVVEPVCKLGELWELGNHRLLCGDATSKEAVDKLMQNGKVDMVFTDPPYNLKGHGQSKRTNKTKTKTQDFGEWDKNFDPLTVLPNINAITADNGHIFICTSNWLFGSIHSWFEKIGHKPNYLVWRKKNPMPSLSKKSFVQATEIIIHSRKGSPNFVYPKGANLPNVIEGRVEKHEFGHPTQKPIYVIQYCLDPVKPATVYDCFGGSGSTLIACEKTNRKCYMMELDPHYCDVIITRWENYTNQKAKRHKSAKG